MTLHVRQNNILYSMTYPTPWRRGWDSNPREACTSTGFRDRPIQPLWHLSGERRILAVPQRFDQAPATRHNRQPSEQRDQQMRVGPCAAFIGCAWCACAPSAQSQTLPVPYPSKPVRPIPGPAPGSGTDIVARAVAEKLSGRLGQSVIVEESPRGGRHACGGSGRESDARRLYLALQLGRAGDSPALYRQLLVPPGEGPGAHNAARGAAPSARRPSFAPRQGT